MGVGIKQIHIYDTDGKAKAIRNWGGSNIECLLPNTARRDVGEKNLPAFRVDGRGDLRDAAFRLLSSSYRL